MRRLVGWLLDRVCALIPIDLNDIDTSDLGDE
jgi:hypothetical protein